MRTVLATIALLITLVPSASAATVEITRLVVQNGSITLAWDDNPEPDITKYVVSYGQVCGTWLYYKEEPRVTQTVIALDTTKPWCFTVQAANSAGEISDYSDVAVYDPLTEPPPPPQEDPRCAQPFGDRAVAIFITTFQPTTGSQGSRARLNFQIASPNSPITKLVVKVNGAPAETGTMEGTDLTYAGGIWFRYPLVNGTYTVSLEIRNAYGCVGESGKDAVGNPITFTIGG